ncbi:BMC domain-containing protein [Desulfospira joergensenii]|uniref:BMC domain-containing protein n=1 Tax=Desulfospira joergensenii TaxID=53329 RepID=UPI0003B75EE6|nr:BMC domain-containing protein [Desulfospira joergensenii]
MQAELQALGMIEFNSIAAGIEAADYMAKAARVEPMFLKTICPGKFLAAVHGEIASVNSSIDAGKACCGETVVDHFVIPNINPEVVKAISGTSSGIHGPAVGVIETFSVPSAVLAADYASKAADVFISEVRIAMGLGGKAFCLLSGDVAAVQAAVDAGSASAKESGLLVRNVVIPAMDSQVRQFVL